MLETLKQKILNRKGALDRPIPDFTGEDANKLIYDAILKDGPLMVARFGAFELGMALSAQTPITLKNIVRLLKGDISSIGWKKSLANSLCNNAGFFPNDKNLIKDFSDLLIADCKEVDILASWLSGEKLLSNQIGGGKYQSIRRIDIEPYYFENPWTLALANKKVLVIHPYEASIKHQWEKRHLLFGEKIIMPDCDLRILKSVQSIAGNKTGFATWFDALESMKSKMDSIDYDIALIGCGAYGFHLAAHAKRRGHKGIHVGGVLQMFFGIMGNRWENKFEFVNDNWIRPLPADRPNGASTIENGCYW